MEKHEFFMLSAFIKKQRSYIACRISFYIHICNGPFVSFVRLLQ